MGFISSQKKKRREKEMERNLSPNLKTSDRLKSKIEGSTKSRLAREGCELISPSN